MFKDIELKDKELLESYLKPMKFLGCEYSFVNMFMWQPVYKTQYLIKDNVLYFRSIHEFGTVYYLPVSKEYKTLCESVQFVVSHKDDHGGNIYIMGLDDREYEMFKNSCGSKFSFTSKREYFDYIYNSSDLINLTGKKFQAKRNHINKFVALYGEPHFEMITKDNIHEVYEVDTKWREDREENSEDEAAAVKTVIDHFFELGMIGGLIRIEGKVVAFTMGSEISSETFDIHIEKADKNIQGLYAVINNQFAKNCLSSYVFINREEDLGIEGLRKAKLSYNPAVILNKYIAKYEG